MADNAHTIDIQDNRTVVGLLRAGDEKCFDALFRRYYKPLCTYATRFVPPVRAEELVQDTLMWVWENRTSLIPEMPLKSLLFTIVKNKSLNSASRDTLKNRIIRQLAEHYEETFDDPDFYLEGELVQRLTEALRKMPPEFRQTFRMHRLEGMIPQRNSQPASTFPRRRSITVSGRPCACCARNSAITGRCSCCCCGLTSPDKEI